MSASHGARAMTRLVSANVDSSLGLDPARRCLDAALDVEPDVVSLQEWRLRRFALLRRTGRVIVAGSPVVASGKGSMAWVVNGAGDCVLGLRSQRYPVQAHRSVLLSRPRIADAGVRRGGILPPRWATVVLADDLARGQRVGLLAFHLVPGAQRAGRYRADRPRTSAQHTREVTVLGRIVTTLSSRCDAVWALGDSNFHGLQLPGLTSAWDGVPGSVGTLGSYRRVDDVFGSGPPQRVEMFVTESDHRMVVAEYG